MTSEPAEDFTALHERILTFVGAFSSTQFLIDSMVGMYLRRKLPSLGKELDKQFLGRVKDEQRMLLFKAFVAEVNYVVDVPVFSTIYKRAKQVRDMIGHSHWIGGPVGAAGVVGVASTVPERNKTLVPNPLFPSTFTRLKADCEWLIEHVNRAGFEGNACDFVTGGGQPYEPPIPQARPVLGEPLR